MKFELDDLHINYTLTNFKTNNEYVLFLHGFGGSTKSFEGLQNYISNKINTISLDLIGFGKSSKPPKYFTIFDYAEVVFKLLKKLNVSKVNIVAHSFGGRIAIILASKYKTLISKLVLIDSAGIKPRFSLKTFLKIKYFKFLKILAKLKLIKKQKLKKYGSSDYKSLTEDEKQVFNRVIKEDLTCLLKEIVAETLIIWGKKDKDTPLYMAKKLHKKIKNSGLVVFDKAGHYSYLDEFFKTQLILKSFFNLGE
jgi:pimeloyl-ACP methyl ester carboxylesterase